MSTEAPKVPGKDIDRVCVLINHKYKDNIVNNWVIFKEQFSMGPSIEEIGKTVTYLKNIIKITAEDNVKLVRKNAEVEKKFAEVRKLNDIQDENVDKSMRLVERENDKLKKLIEANKKENTQLRKELETTKKDLEYCRVDVSILLSNVERLKGKIQFLLQVLKKKKGEVVKEKEIMKKKEEVELEKKKEKEANERKKELRKVEVDKKKNIVEREKIEKEKKRLESERKKIVKEKKELEKKKGEVNKQSVKVQKEKEKVEKEIDEKEKKKRDREKKKRQIIQSLRAKKIPLNRLSKKTIESIPMKFSRNRKHIYAKIDKSGMECSKQKDSSGYSCASINKVLTKGSKVWKMRYTCLGTQSDDVNTAPFIGVYDPTKLMLSKAPQTFIGSENIPRSWGINLYHGKLIYNGVVGKKILSKVKNGDILKMSLNLDKGTLECFVNDKSCGLVVEKLKGPLSPCISIRNDNEKFKIV